MGRFNDFLGFDPAKAHDIGTTATSDWAPLYQEAGLELWGHMNKLNPGKYQFDEGADAKRSAKDNLPAPTTKVAKTDQGRRNSELFERMLQGLPHLDASTVPVPEGQQVRERGFIGMSHLIDNETIREKAVANPTRYFPRAMPEHPEDQQNA